jgi:hypothetical protein
MKINSLNKINKNEYIYYISNNIKKIISSKFNIFLIFAILVSNINCYYLNNAIYFNKNGKEYIEKNEKKNNKNKNPIINIDNFKYFFLRNSRLLNVIYHPFDNEVNSIYGTGNALKDVVYKDYCHIICNTRCCSGNDIQKLKCLTVLQCEILLNRIKVFTLYIIFVCYIGFSIITSIIIFFVYFCITRRNHNFSKSFKIGFTYGFITFSAFTIFGILLIYLISKKKKKKIIELFWGDDSINLNDFSMKINLREDEKPKKNMKMKQINSELNTERDNDILNIKDKFERIDCEINLDRVKNTINNSDNENDNDYDNDNDNYDYNIKKGIVIGKGKNTFNKGNRNDNYHEISIDSGYVNRKKFYINCIENEILQKENKEEICDYNHNYIYNSNKDSKDNENNGDIIIELDEQINFKQIYKT